MSNSSSLIPPPTTINDAHKVYTIAIAVGVLCGITTFIGLLRLYTRWRAHALGPDDYVFVPALLFYDGWSAMSIYVNLHAGVGKPLWEITLGEFSVWFKGILGSAWLYPPMSMLIRLSILLFYQRIFSVPGSTYRPLVRILVAIQPLYLIVFSILPAFICVPLYKAWDPLERQEYFHDWYYYYTQVGLYSVSMAFDAILLLLPLWPVWKLHLPVRQRIGISLVFMLGAAASIAAAYKLAIFVIEMQRYTHINPHWLEYEMSTLIPPQFDTYGTTFWIPSQVEPTVALIGASLPALRKPLSAVVPRLSKFWASVVVSKSPTRDSRAKTKREGTTKTSQPRKTTLGASKGDSTSHIREWDTATDHSHRSYVQLEELN